MDEREALSMMWNDWWSNETWIAPWEKALSSLSAEQAAWKPNSEAHSIWQNVNHVIFWRELTLTLLSGGKRPPSEETDRRNFEAPTETTDAAWKSAIAKLESTQKRMGAAIQDSQNPLDRLRHHLPHDAYHLGQIMYLRGLQGLKSIV